MSAESGNKPKVDVGTIIAIVALILSLASAYLQFFWKSHDLRGSLVKIAQKDGRLSGDILLINRGNQAEVVLSVRFIFSSDFGAGASSQSKETVGPFVLKPGDAMLQPLSGDLSDVIRAAEAAGSAEPQNSKVHVGAEFIAVDPSGQLMSRLYKVASIQLRDGQSVNTNIGKDDDREPIQLLYGGSVDD